MQVFALVDEETNPSNVEFLEVIYDKVEQIRIRRPGDHFKNISGTGAAAAADSCPGAPLGLVARPARTCPMSRPPSPLGSDDRGQNPGLPLAPPAAPDPARSGATLMRRVMAEMRARLQEGQDRRRQSSTPLGGTWGTSCCVTHAPSLPLFVSSCGPSRSPRTRRPTHTASTSPVEHLSPYLCLPDRHCGGLGPAAVGAWRRRHVRVRDAGAAQVQDAALRLLAAPPARRRRARPALPPTGDRASAGCCTHMNPPAGYTVDAAPPGDLGEGLVGRTASARAAPSRRLARGGLHAAVVVARPSGHAALRRILRLPLDASLAGTAGCFSRRHGVGEGSIQREP